MDRPAHGWSPFAARIVFRRLQSAYSHLLVDIPRLSRYPGVPLASCMGTMGVRLNGLLTKPARRYQSAPTNATSHQVEYT